MENTELIRAIKDIGYYHEIAKQKCEQLEKALELMQQAADSSAACKKTRVSKKLRLEALIDKVSITKYVRETDGYSFYVNHKKLQGVVKLRYVHEFQHILRLIEKEV